MNIPDSVLVVGAAAGGLSTVEALRRKGYQGMITVLGAEAHAPYDRPPLSKQVLAGAWPPERTTLRTPERLSTLDAEFVLGDPAVALDPRAREVRTASGETLRSGAIVVATGVRPRTLPGQEELSGVHVLRTLEDALALRADLLAAKTLVVVGEGVLGAEIAATAKGMGLDVTMAGPMPAPMAAQLGQRVSETLSGLHARHGIRLRLGAGVRRLTGEDGRVAGVELRTGEVLPADVVVVAIGAVPVVDWLETSGLRLDNGLVCDSRCRAADGIYAVGDVARWHHEPLGRSLRLENRTNATEQAGAVAANILGADEPYTPVPYFWTDQFDVKIQVHGTLPTGAQVSIVDSAEDGGRFVARYEHEDRVAGVLGWNMPKQVRLRRQEVVDSHAAPTHSSALTSN
ncbi:NAD(P)/FAD-dependent oxidoreductase [Amycolatopsis taiwanensis]|uniref:NAD(P)/FAD-dependent oxidoreductase n=1 Tax=Amycolatopsis taiwanensis TaxID=342230 RepID=UPI00048A2DC4|nr:FAD-dependent oxidoreductase [Amycolatopsis taiwanensis]